MKKITKILALTFAGVLFSVFAFVAHAQNIGVQISPLTYNLDINGGESQEAKITVTNLNSTDLNYVIETENIDKVSDEGAPSFSGTTSDSSVTTLKDWITTKNTTDNAGIIAVGDSKDIVFDISIPVGAEPGGHYAAIFAKEIKKNAQGQTELGVSSRVGTIILVSVPGNVSKSAEITNFSAPKFAWHGPIDLSMKVKNTGSVHYDSSANVNIKSMFGKKTVVDLGKHTIIPNNERSYAGSWQSKYPFGRYVLTASATDGNGNPVTTQSVLWAIPLIIIIPAIIGIILLIWVIAYFRRHVKIV